MNIDEIFGLVGGSLVVMVFGGTLLASGVIPLPKICFRSDHEKLSHLEQELIKNKRYEKEAVERGEKALKDIIQYLESGNAVWGYDNRNFLTKKFGSLVKKHLNKYKVTNGSGGAKS